MAQVAEAMVVVIFVAGLAVCLGVGSMVLTWLLERVVPPVAAIAVGIAIWIGLID